MGYVWTTAGDFYEKEVANTTALRIAFGDGTWGRTIADQWNLLRIVRQPGAIIPNSEILAVCDQGCERPHGHRFPVGGKAISTTWRGMKDNSFAKVTITCSSDQRSQVPLEANRKTVVDAIAADGCASSIAVDGLPSHSESSDGEYVWTTAGDFYEKEVTNTTALRIAFGDGTWGRTVAGQWN